jgi:hypothetical protein
MINLSRTKGRVAVRLTAMQVGPDWTVAIYGGDGPHVGAVALAGPSPAAPNRGCGHKGGHSGAPDGPCRSISLPGHREGELAGETAAALAAHLGAAVSVSCGIHLDGIAQEEIVCVREVVGLLSQDLLAAIEGAPFADTGGGDGATREALGPE